MLLKTLRRLRHGPLKRYNKLWIYWGNLYRRLTKILGLSYSVKMKIGEYGPYKFNPYFSFSNFSHWGGGHNNGFSECVTACKGKQCVFDIGAHIGLVSMPMASVMGASAAVYAFEPASMNRHFLEEHVSRNRFNNIKVYDCLVGDTDLEKVEFFEHPEASGMNSILQRRDQQGYVKSYKQQITLDRFCEQHHLRPDVIKIDVEGAEIGVLKGACNIIKQCKPLIFLSVHPTHIEQLGSSLDELSHLIKGLSYEIRHIDGRSVKTFALEEYILAPACNSDESNL